MSKQNEKPQLKEVMECYKCYNTKLILLPSQNKKICNDCGEHLPWYHDLPKKK